MGILFLIIFYSVERYAVQTNACGGTSGSSCGNTSVLRIVKKSSFFRGLSPGLVILFCAFTALISSCTTNLAQVRQENASQILTLYRARPLAAANNGNTSLSVHDCVRLAFENSLDLQTALWDEQVRAKLAAGSVLRMLPKTEFDYFLTTRDRPLWSRSDVYGQEGAWEVVGPGPGTGVTQWSTGRERFSRNWSLQMKWSPMDALMANYLSKMRGNEAIYSGYQRARVAQQLTSTITCAFFRLLALNQILPKARALEGNRARILQDVESLHKAALVDPQEYLTAKSLLAEAKQQASDIYLTIGKQRELLAVAMNVCPDSAFQVLGELLPLPRAELDSCKLEAAALVNRPEAYQADLTFGNSIAEKQRLMVKFFPRAEGFVGYWRDENKFVMNKNWNDGGLRITFDFLEFTANLLEHAAAKDKVMKTDRERALISLGIVSQVRLRVLDAMRALERYNKQCSLENQAKEALRISTEVERTKDKQAPQKIMRIAREKALCNLLQVEIDRIGAVGEVHAAMAELDAAVGTNYPVSTVLPVPRTAVFRPLLEKPVTAFRKAAGFLGGAFFR